MRADTVSKIIMPNVDELAREHFVRTLKRSVLVLVLLIALVVLINEKQKILLLIDHPIEKISVLGQFTHLDEVLLKEHLSRFIGTGFLSADLVEVKKYVELLPWVDQAQISRVWPGELNVIIEEQVAVSYWNEQGFINPRGELFMPLNMDKTLALPVLSHHGSLDDKGRLEMFNLLQYIQKELHVSNLDAVRLSQSLRGAWDVTLANGVSVALGHIDLESGQRKYLDDKLERVGKLFMAKNNIELENIQKLDTRYPNGIAVQWKEPLENKK